MRKYANNEEVFEYYSIPYKYPYLSDAQIFVYLYTEEIDKDLVSQYMDEPQFLMNLYKFLSGGDKIELIKKITRLWKLLDLNDNDEFIFFQSIVFLSNINKKLYCQGYNIYCDIDVLVNQLPFLLFKTSERREEIINNVQMYASDDTNNSMDYQLNMLFAELSVLIGKEHIKIYSLLLNKQ
jgi:hypothetical protein